MTASLWVAKVGLEAQDAMMQNISQNLANVNTTGYKAKRVEFEDLFYQNVNLAGSQNQEGNTDPSSVQLGTGVKISAIQSDFSQGSVEMTGNELDVAINGRGFLIVEMPDGTDGYTRNGQLRLNQDGELVTAQGYRLRGGITIPDDATQIAINKEGVIEVRIAGESDYQEVGTLELAMFQNPGGLTSLGENLFQETPASGDPIIGDPNDEGLGSIEQFALETSNVSSVEEMVAMIEVQRAYEMLANAMSKADEMSQTVNQKLGS